MARALGMWAGTRGLKGGKARGLTVLDDIVR